MGNYFWSISGIQRDELAGSPGVLQDIWNVPVGASAVIERGMLLCADSPTAEWAQVTSTVDAAKVLGIARDNFTADNDHDVTQVYASGTFNRERIKLGGGSSLTIEPFVKPLKEQGIRLTHIEDKFGHEKN
ncbi:MAG: hypothetical protein J5497_07665 [Selenomonadaceae bacterium]|nr:hypothetical protein [Selenomonadaceae bacterium]